VTQNPRDAAVSGTLTFSRRDAEAQRFVRFFPALRALAPGREFRPVNPVLDPPGLFYPRISPIGGDAALSAKICEICG